MKKLIGILSVTVLSLIVRSDEMPLTPVIVANSVSLSQASSSRLVTIDYQLDGAPAIITVDILTNGVSIGGENLWNMKGDVHKIVDQGVRRILWRADKAWPGHVIEGGVTAVVTAWATNTPPDYMVVDLEAKGSVNFYARAEELPDGVGHRRYKTTKLVLRKIPAGGVQWRAGRRTTDAPSNVGDQDAHLVTLAEDYYMGIYELTQRQYELMMVKQSDTAKIRPSYNTTPDYEVLPVERVSVNHYLRGQASLGYSWLIGLRAEFFANPIKYPPVSLRGCFEVVTQSGTHRIDARLDAGIASATIDVGKLAMGTHPISFELLGGSGQKLGRAEVQFTRVARLPDRKVWIDRHNRTIVDGKPFFPMGMYFTGVKEHLLDYYAKGPFNCLMPYNWPDRKQLDMCLKRNLRVIYPMERAYPGGRSITHSKKRGTEYVREMFDKVGDHPAILAWYICDELPASMDWALKKRHNFLCKVDPNHPTWCVIYEPENYRPFLGGYDVAGVDPYPIGNHGDANATAISIASSWPLTAKKAMFGFRPMWNVPQAFNWGWYRKAEYGKDGVRMPTEEELRSMTWQSIAAGANGIVYYSFFNIFDGEKEPLRTRIFDYVCKVAREVRDQEQILLSPLPSPEIRRGPYGIVARSWKTSSGETYLLACNILREAVSGTVSVEGCKDHALDLPAIGVFFGKLNAAPLRYKKDQMNRIGK